MKKEIILDVYAFDKPTKPGSIAAAFFTMLCIAALALTGCNSRTLDRVFGTDNESDIEVNGDGNTVVIGDGAQTAPAPLPTPTPTATPDEAGGWVVALLGISLLLSGCLGPVTFAPNVTVGVNSGSQGSPTASGSRGQPNSLSYAPQIDREGGASVQTSAALPELPAP
jgi:hypothetical protein